MINQPAGRTVPLSPAALDRQAAIADARLVLGVIDVLDHLDEQDGSEPLGAQIARLQNWLDQPAPGAVSGDAGGQELIGRLFG
ncbi:MAG: hypothetical protein HDQ87_06520 [Clostridia bacterium]|nr:hypothetical protein [Clostridia bacterium]